jgi:hypothetical protein
VGICVTLGMCYGLPMTDEGMSDIEAIRAAGIDTLQAQQAQHAPEWLVYNAPGRHTVAFGVDYALGQTAGGETAWFATRGARRWVPGEPPPADLAGLAPSVEHVTGTRAEVLAVVAGWMQP